MNAEVNEWIDIVHKAWHDLLDDFEKFGEKSGYGDMREEDVRSYLFCKISDVMRKRGKWLIELHAEQPLLPESRADLVVGVIDSNSWAVGIEIKRSGQKKPLTDDLDKLFSFMKKGQISSGILATTCGHWDGWEPIFKGWRLGEKFRLESENKGDNNYWEIRELKEIPVENKVKRLDSLFFVLRKR